MIEKGATLSMKDCLEIALNNSPLIKKARYNYGISEKSYSIAKAAYFPTIGIGTGYYVNSNSSSNRGGIYNRNMSTSNNYYSAEASLNQLIWNFGKTNANIRMYNFYKIAAIFDFDNIVLDTLFEVKMNYYDYGYNYYNKVSAANSIFAANTAVINLINHIMLNENSSANKQRDIITEKFKQLIDYKTSLINLQPEE